MQLNDLCHTFSIPSLKLQPTQISLASHNTQQTPRKPASAKVDVNPIKIKESNMGDDLAIKKYYDDLRSQKKEEDPKNNEKETLHPSHGTRARPLGSRAQNETAHNQRASEGNYKNYKSYVDYVNVYHSEDVRDF